MSHSALANLTAQYTDSENEEYNQVESGDTLDSQSSQVVIPKVSTPVENSKSFQNRPTSSKSRRPKKALRLVSYQDDTFISDDSRDVLSEDESISAMESEEEAITIATEITSNKLNFDVCPPSAIDSEQLNEGAPVGSSDGNEKVATKIEKSEKYAHYGFSLPSEPKSKPSPELVEKIKHFYDTMEKNNMDMNRIIQQRKDFRNPSIYEKLIQFCDINEFGTNYPMEVYDPLQWGAESFYEELARVQKVEMLKRQKERKDNDKIEQATALARKVEEEAKKRKSKWDQPAPVKAVIATALTTTVTGTKGTVISAFGSLPKKPLL